MPAQESKYHGGGQLYPEYPAGQGCLTVPATTAKPEVAEYGDKVFSGQLVLAGFAVRWWKYNGLVPRQTVDTHIKEAAHCQTDDGEQDY